MKILKINSFVLIILALFGGDIYAEEMQVDCSTSPKEAILVIPSPLDKYIKIGCTKFGHIIAAKENISWFVPGALTPVFLPAQMVKSNPKLVGNGIYFTELELTKLTNQTDRDEALNQHIQVSGMSVDKAGEIYQLLAKNNLTKDLWKATFYYDTSSDSKGISAIYCNYTCGSSLLLDMSRK